MQKQNRISVFLLIILLVLTFIYMFIDTIKSDEKVETYEIAVITRSKNNESLTILKEGTEQAAIDLNVDIRFIFLSEENSIEEQVDLLIRESENDIDAIIIDPIESEKVAKTIKNINREMPVIIIQSLIDNIDGINTVICNEYECGKKLIEVALKDSEEKNAKGNVLIISTNGEESSVKAIKNGAINILQQYNKDYIICNIQQDDKQMYSKLREKIIGWDIDKVICLDIESTEYMAEYKNIYRENNYSNVNFDLYGVGSTNRIISFLEQSIINGVAIRNEFSIGYLAIENSVKLKKNKKVSSKILGTKVIKSEDMYSEENERLLFQFIR